MPLPYNRRLKINARHLRNNLTDAEKLLWFHLRRKQLHNVQFYRQRPIGNYIVDFYAPSAKLVIEVDGGQHFEKDHMQRDKMRDDYLMKQNLKIFRFDNLQVLRSVNAVLEVIFNELSKNPLAQNCKKIPPLRKSKKRAAAPFKKGAKKTLF